MLFVWNSPIRQLFVWTYKTLPPSIRYSPDLNTYILDENDEYLSNRSESAQTICGSESNKYLTLMHVTRITRIKIWLIIWKWLNFIQYSLWYLLRGRILRPRTIIFLLCLLFDLDIRALIFSLTTNLKVGPRFAGLCYLGYFFIS